MSLTRRQLAAGAASLLGARAARPSVRPNIVWISIEDTSPYLGCYGDRRAVTPALDRLAGEGIRYTNVYTVAGVCAPSRSGIITGMYPSSLGSMHMRCQARLPKEVRCFPAWLRDAGYRCTNNAKTDYNFPVPREAWDESSGKAHWRGRKPGQPFFAVFNFTTTHESRIRFTGEQWAKTTADVKPEQRQDPARVPVPPYWPDTPVVRRQIANVYELVTQVDRQVAGVLSELERDGLAGETIVFFWGDHGVGLPRAKRWLYDSGTRVPLIVRIPEKLRTAGQGRPGTVDGQLINAVDFGPTVLNLAGIPVPAHMHGRAFLGAGLTPPRRYVYGARDRMDERYDIIRTVRDLRYRYVRNYESFKPYYQFMRTSEGSPVMEELRRLHSQGKLPPAAAQFMAARKPPEELYDLEADPHEVRNLAGSAGHAAVLARLRLAHREWMLRICDVGLIPEPELVEGEKRFGSRHAILRQPGGARLLERLMAAVEAGERGDRPALEALLAEPEPALRYWGSVGLGNAHHRPEKLRAALSDSSAAVRVAAARALGDVAAAVRELTNENEWVRLQAAIVLDEMGPAARPAAAALKAALEDSNNYVGRVAEHALAGLGA